jgi:hypothetical protein
MRVCNLYLLLLCLHGMCAYMAGAWQHQEGSIVRQLLMPELVFWQTMTQKTSKAAFDPGGQQWVVASGASGYGNQVETGKRELEGFSKATSGQVLHFILKPFLLNLTFLDLCFQHVSCW